MLTSAVDPATLGPLGRAAYRSMELLDGMVDRVRRPDFDMAEWDAFAELFATDAFRRVAANREERGWDEDIRLLTAFAKVAEFRCDVRRIAECGDRVYVDAIETILTGTDPFAVNTLAVIEFDAAGRIRRKTTFQQWDPGRVPTHVGRSAD